LKFKGEPDPNFFHERTVNKPQGYETIRNVWNKWAVNKKEANLWQYQTETTQLTLALNSNLGGGGYFALEYRCVSG